MKPKNTSLLLCVFNLPAEGYKASANCLHRIRLVQSGLIQNSLYSWVLGMEQLELAKFFLKAHCSCTHSRIRSSFVCELSLERKSWHWKSAKPLIARVLKKTQKHRSMHSNSSPEHFKILGVYVVICSTGNRAGLDCFRNTGPLPQLVLTKGPTQKEVSSFRLMKRSICSPSICSTFYRGPCTCPHCLVICYTLLFHNHFLYFHKVMKKETLHELCAMKLNFFKKTIPELLKQRLGRRRKPHKRRVQSQQDTYFKWRRSSERRSFMWKRVTAQFLLLS